MTDRDKLVQVAKLYREMMALKAEQAATQATLIRWCVMALTQTYQQAEQALERERKGNPGHKYGPLVRHGEAGKKVKEDHDLALLYLQWLATKLDDQAPDPTLDARVAAAIVKSQ